MNLLQRVLDALKPHWEIEDHVEKEIQRRADKHIEERERLMEVRRKTDRLYRLVSEMRDPLDDVN